MPSPTCSLSGGSRAVLLERLLAETLEDISVREDVLDRTLRAANLKPTLSPAARLWLESMTAAEAAHWLIGGLAWDELPFEAESLAAVVASDRDNGFALPPLPNHMFTRDTSAWIYGGVTVNAMAKPARARESIHLDAIYKHHPLFAGRDFELWSDSWALPPHLEGGDILVIGNGAVLVGMGERTTPVAVELLAERLFAAEAATEVIAVLLPAQRSSMHLDTVMTMIDRDAFTIYPDLRGALVPYVIHPGRSGLMIEKREDLFVEIARALDLPSVRLVETGATATSPSASSGTTATTSLLSRRVWSSPTSGTSRRTRAFATRTSR